MNTDAELLRRFVDDGSEAAFTALVQRHLPLVRATALRRVGGDAHAADDVAQQVFVALARKAPSLRGHATLCGWLYLSTHHATADWVRREQRRKQREATAHSMQLADSSSDASADAARLRPLLDDALVSLKPEEREALVLRFFSGRTFAEIGDVLVLSEEAARKRVDRALEKLHGVLVRRGVTSTAMALGAALTVAGTAAVPSGLAAKVAVAALGKAAAPTLLGSLAQVFWPVATVAAVVGGTLVILPQHRANSETEATLTRRESSMRAARAAVAQEARQLERELVQARTVVAAVAQATTTRTPAVPTGAAPASPAAFAGVTVAVSKEGALQWNGEPVRLDDFLERIVRLQATAGAEARLTVDAKGARFGQLNWVLDETRKAGISHLLVESDAAPVGRMSTWF
jgi:RNA polymerase sigma factor (sigma-70 family)